MSVLWYHLKCANYAIYGARVKRLSSLKGLINFKIMCVVFSAISHVVGLLNEKLTGAGIAYSAPKSTEFQIAFDNWQRHLAKTRIIYA